VRGRLELLRGGEKQPLVWFLGNASQVSNWVAAGARGRLVVNAPFSGGSVLVRGASSPSAGTGVRVVLQGNGSGAYHVLTGFPVP